MMQFDEIDVKTWESLLTQQFKYLILMQSLCLPILIGLACSSPVIQFISLWDDMVKESNKLRRSKHLSVIK